MKIPVFVTLEARFSMVFCSSNVDYYSYYSLEELTCICLISNVVIDRGYRYGHPLITHAFVQLGELHFAL